MTIQDWGALGEAAGGIAVIITLIYLAIQVRQNTSIVKSTNYLNLSGEVTDFAKMIAESAEMNDLYMKGCEDFNTLPVAEKSRFNMIMSTLIQPYQSMYQMKRRGHIDKELMLLSFDILSSLLKQPGVRQWWEENKHWWESDFQGFMQSFSS